MSVPTSFTLPVFQGRTALVVGGASGIGAATVQRLRAQGAEVVVADRTASDGALQCDVRDEASVEAAVGYFVRTHRRLDLAVNAAGIPGTAAPINELTSEQWQEVMAVNLTGVFYCLRAEIAAMREGRTGGSIVNVASVAAFAGVPTMTHYSAAKAGVVAMTKAAALETATTGIRVNAVCPGSVRTPTLERWHGTEESLSRVGQTWPMQRLANPAEIAAAIVWLLSDDSTYSTGLALPVDGGGSARR